MNSYIILGYLKLARGTLSFESFKKIKYSLGLYVALCFENEDSMFTLYFNVIISIFFHRKIL
jgi:hypothetical protein